MIFRRAVRFKREFKALSSDIQDIARAKFALFSSNWRHPQDSSYSTHIGGFIMLEERAIAKPPAGLLGGRRFP
jgi:hypothetical protein